MFIPGVSAESQALRGAILSQVEPVSPDYRIHVPTRTGYLYWNHLLNQADPLMRVDDNGYGLLGQHPVESERSRRCFQAVVQARLGDRETQWLVHSGPFSPLSADALVSPIVRLPNHLMLGEHLTGVDFLVGLDTVQEAVEAAEAYLGKIQLKPAITIRKVPVPFHIFDIQVVDHNGFPDITAWQFNREGNGFSLV